MDVRTAQDELEDAIRDAVLFALGKRSAVASLDELRALVTRGASGGSVMHDDMLAAVTVESSTTGWRWSSKSTADDDDTDVVKPNDVLEGPGRWLRYESPLRIALTVGGNSKYLHEITSGPLERVIVLDKNMQDEEVSALIMGQVPSVVIETTDDTTEPVVESTGRLLNVEYHLTISVIAQNLRDRRQHAQGSTFSGEPSRGANNIDGLIQSLLVGTSLYNVLDGVRDVLVGRGYNWLSEQAQRRVIRGRAYTVLATVENPPAPNDTADAETIFAQAELTELGEQDDWSFDDYVKSGLTVGLGVGLARTVAAGVAVIAEEDVAFDGELVTFAASTLTYRDLASDGTMTYVETGLGEAEPAVTDGCLRIGVTTTDGSGVVADRLIARSREAYGANFQHDL